MARIVKDYDERYTEFLDAAQALFFSKGYEQTSVQDIIKAVGVAKGTFYHYFDSKVDILDAVVKRTRETVLRSVAPIVDDESMDAISKFITFFDSINRWKIGNHEIIFNMLRMLYQDENAVLRLKMFEEARRHVTEPLARIIAAGSASGEFVVDYAYETADVIMRLIELPSNTLIAVILDGRYGDADVAAIKREVHVFNRCVERILGLQENTINLIKEENLTDWLGFLEKSSVDTVA